MDLWSLTCRDVKDLIMVFFVEQQFCASACRPQRLIQFFFSLLQLLGITQEPIFFDNICVSVGSLEELRHVDDTLRWELPTCEGIPVLYIVVFNVAAGLSWQPMFVFLILAIRGLLTFFFWISSPLFLVMATHSASTVDWNVVFLLVCVYVGGGLSSTRTCLY